MGVSVSSQDHRLIISAIALAPKKIRDCPITFSSNPSSAIFTGFEGGEIATMHFD
jgi:hypothetical protein